MSRVVMRPVELAGGVGEMNKQLPAWAIWCIAASLNALAWTGIVSMGSWLAGGSIGTSHLLTLFACVTAIGFAIQALLASGRNGG